MTAESAYEWGLRHNSCAPALNQRQDLGPGATQADWWLVCDRGDWLIWQLQRLPADELRPVRAALHRATERIVARAIRRAQKSLRGVRAEWATQWRRWARRWLSGEDRTAAAAAAAEAAWAAAEAAAAEAAWARARAAEAWELKLQARDIRREIPVWSMEVEDE